MQYSEIKIPPRSDHLWRYTQWKRIHPTEVSEVPSASEIRFSDGEEVSMKGSDEIARSFIHQLQWNLKVVCKLEQKEKFKRKN